MIDLPWNGDPSPVAKEVCPRTGRTLLAHFPAPVDVERAAAYHRQREREAARKERVKGGRSDG